MNPGKIPEDIKPFYERFNSETPTSPDEEDGKKEDGGKKGKEKKKEGKKDKKAKKGGKKEKGAEESSKIFYGPTEAVTKFDE